MLRTQHTQSDARSDARRDEGEGRRVSFGTRSEQPAPGARRDSADSLSSAQEHHHPHSRRPSSDRKREL